MAKSDESNALDFATTSQLMAELVKRSRGLVVGMDPLAQQDGQYLILCEGSFLICSGLSKAVTMASDCRLVASLGKATPMQLEE